MKTKENVIHLNTSYLHVTHNGKKLRVPLRDILKPNRFAVDYLPKALRTCLDNASTDTLEDYSKSYLVWGESV
jgi:hypothetical protein